MKLIGNILWFLIEGIFLFLAWIMAGIVMCITIIGIPLGIQCFKIAGFVLFPFGKKIHYGGGAGKFILNIIWIVVCGWELALASLGMGLIWCITIVGIPFGLQSFKLAKLAFMPFGARITK